MAKHRAHSLIFLRGLMHHAGHWHGLVDSMQQAHPHWTMRTVDFPGVGERCQQPAPAFINGMVESVREQLEPGPNVVVATSLGAMVAAAWAHRYPREVSGLLLMVPSTADMPLYARLQPAAMGRLLLALAARRAARVAYQVERMTAQRGDDPEHRRIAAERIVLVRRHPPRRQVLLRQLWAARTFRLPPAPACPVRLLAAGADDMVRPGCARLWGRRWGVPVLAHPRSGHDLRVDAPEWLSQQINSFLRLYSA